MKTTRKILSLILAVTMLLSVCSFSVMADEDATASVTLSDIDYSTTVGKAVSRLVSMGIINGYPDGTFKAENTITRAEFCVVMVKFEGLQQNISADAMSGFEDLDMDENYAWVRPYVSLAVQRGIINGFEDGTFRAADPVTYEQAVKMIMCSLGYASLAATPTIAGDWSSGYINRAMKIGVTNGTSINNKTAATTRGIVAILTSNALDAARADTVLDGNLVIKNDDTLTERGYSEVTGIVTGTYITELEAEKSFVPKNHIQIDDEIYEIGFSADPYTFLGCSVTAVVDNSSDGDYPLAKSLEPTKKNSVIEVKAGFVGDYEDGELSYQTKKDGNWKSARIEEEYITIFNNKYCEDYDISDLKEELVNGSVELIDNDGDSRIEVVRVNSYDVFVVYSKSSSQKITLMYDALYEGSNTIVFPEESTSVVFSLTRNGKAISFSDIAKWDVLNIKASDDDAAGRRYYEVVVTRSTVSGTIEEIEESDYGIYVTIGSKEYLVAESYEEFDGEEKVEFDAGDTVQVYLNAFDQIVAAAKTSTGDSDEKYAYMWGLRQNSTNSDYDLEFWLYKPDGKSMTIGAASKITIDGVKYKATDDDILDYLTETAESANQYYRSAENVVYQQPIIYQTNSEGLVSNIYTVSSTEHDGISNVMNNDEDTYFVKCDERTYKSSSKSFTDFKVNSSTKIIFVPDNRGATDDYLTFSSYSKAFSNSRDYYVEAYGLSSSKNAALVLLYSQNDSRIYTSSSPWMIVASKSTTSSGTVIKGYAGTSYSLKSVTVSEEDGPSISAIGKGDIIRYIVDGNGELIDYDLWFDASDPNQLETVDGSNYKDLYDLGDDDGVNRIIEIHSSSTDYRTDYPTSTFRLQFGTVLELILDEDDDVDDEITIVPVIAEDELDVDAYGAVGMITEEIGSSVKVFYYDRGARNSEVVTDADINEILSYENYGNDASRVIVYTASGTLRMIYIIAE